MLQQKGETVKRALAYAGFWLYRCLKCHPCSKNPPFSEILWPVLPKRIVDVSRLDQGSIRLVAGGRRRSPYCALSYRWQDTTIKSTAESLETFGREIPLNTLQTQLRDACLIASRLGIRYVWIDALVCYPCCSITLEASN